MKIIGVLLSVLMLSCTAWAQETVTQQYYTSRYGKETKDRKKATILVTTTKGADSSWRYEVRETKNGKLLEAKSMKRQEPIGVWRTAEGKEYNYNFNLVYLGKIYTTVDTIPVLYHNENRDPDFKPAVFGMGKSSLNTFLASSVQYPSIARENRIQGRVLVQFIIDYRGMLREVSVYKGVHPMLDKEAVRAISGCPAWKPASIAGDPVNVSVILPITFRLQDQ